MSKLNKNKMKNTIKNKIKKTGGDFSTAAIIIPQSISTAIPISTNADIFTVNNIIFVVYLVFCVILAYYVKEKIAVNYTDLLLALSYSERNQLLCGNTPIERDTIRYTLNKALTSSSVNEMKNVMVAIVFSTIVALIFIVCYILHRYEMIEIPKYFDNIKIYVTNILLVITMGFAIGFWYIYKYKISETKANNNDYESVKKQILTSRLLPNPIPINRTTNNTESNKYLKLANTSSSNTNMLYNTVFKRIMYVDNLNSYQDGVDKWNSFKSNADIFPYLIFSNYNTNNITSDTIEAKDVLNKWQNELTINLELTNATTPTPPPDLNCIQSMYLTYDSPSKTNLNIVYNYYNPQTSQYIHTTLPRSATNIIQISQNGLDNKTIQYINTKVITYLNSKENFASTTQKTIPSTIDGITTYLTVLVGTQNINNDYSILYKEAQDLQLDSETLKNLYWLSTISNGDPSSEINSALNTSKILYYIINVIISYLPFHIIYVNYGGLFTLIVSIICMVVFIILYELYIVYKTTEANNNMFNKNNTV